MCSSFDSSESKVCAIFGSRRKLSLPNRYTGAWYLRSPGTPHRTNSMACQLPAGKWVATWLTCAKRQQMDRLSGRCFRPRRAVWRIDGHGQERRAHEARHFIRTAGAPRRFEPRHLRIDSGGDVCDGGLRVAWKVE